MPALVHSVPVHSPDGRRVQVLFYDDGTYRFRVHETPLYLSECYLQGGRNDHAILKLVPPEAAHVATTAENGEYLRFVATAWWDSHDNTIHVASAKPALRARHKPGTYMWRKLFFPLAAKRPTMFEQNPELNPSEAEE